MLVDLNCIFYAVRLLVSPTVEIGGISDLFVTLIDVYIESTSPLRIIMLGLICGVLLIIIMYVFCSV